MHLPTSLNAVNIRHSEVQQDQVRLEFTESLDSGAAVFGFSAHRPSRANQRGKYPSREFGIINNQDSQVHEPTSLTFLPVPFVLGYTHVLVFFALGFTLYEPTTHPDSSSLYKQSESGRDGRRSQVNPTNVSRK
jgi:hypothetical protein